DLRHVESPVQVNHLHSSYPLIFFLQLQRHPRSTLFPYTTLFRSMNVVVTNAEPLADHQRAVIAEAFHCAVRETYGMNENVAAARDRRSTRLNSSHLGISYAVFCLKKKMPLESLAKKFAYQRIETS